GGAGPPPPPAHWGAGPGPPPTPFPARRPPAPPPPHPAAPLGSRHQGGDHRGRLRRRVPLRPATDRRPSRARPRPSDLPRLGQQDPRPRTETRLACFPAPACSTPFPGRRPLRPPPPGTR